MFAYGARKQNILREIEQSLWKYHQKIVRRRLSNDLRGFSYLVLIEPNYELEWKFRQFLIKLESFISADQKSIVKYIFASLFMQHTDPLLCTVKTPNEVLLYPSLLFLYRIFGYLINKFHINQGTLNEQIQIWRKVVFLVLIESLLSPFLSFVYLSDTTVYWRQMSGFTVGLGQLDA